jgi:transcriptional regulator with XRE-family HTH domain
MVGTDATYDLTRSVPPVRTGWWLGNARRSFAVSERTVAERLGVSARTVRRWESGGTVPTDQQMCAMAALFGCEVVVLVPGPRVGEPLGPGIRAGATGGNDAVLRRYVARIRQERGAAATDRVQLRHDDVEALAVILDLGDSDLQRRLVAIVGITADEARWVGRQLLRRRLLFPVAGVGVVAVGGGTMARLVPSPPAAVVSVAKSEVVADSPVVVDTEALGVAAVGAEPASTSTAPVAQATTAIGSGVTSGDEPVAPSTMTIIPDAQTLPTASPTLPRAAPVAPVIGEALVITREEPGPAVLIDPLVIENPEFVDEIGGR